MPPTVIHTRFYAIRGGPNAGIYVEWDAAQTAGFMQKQGFGNAARFGTRSSAENYAVSAPVSEARQKMVSFLGNTPPVFKLMGFLFMMNLFCFGGSYVVEYVEGWLGCGAGRAADVQCNALARIKLWMSDMVIYYTHATVIQIIGTLTLGAAWFWGLFSA